MALGPGSGELLAGLGRVDGIDVVLPGDDGLACDGDGDAGLEGLVM